MTLALSSTKTAASISAVSFVNQRKKTLLLWNRFVKVFSKFQSSFSVFFTTEVPGLLCVYSQQQYSKSKYKVPKVVNILKQQKLLNSSE